MGAEQAVRATFVAIIINYVKRDDVKGTWLESHFRWQIRTFWFTFFGYILGFVLSLVIVGIFVLIGVYLWSIYRFVRAWLYLNDGKRMYQKSETAKAVASA